MRFRSRIRMKAARASLLALSLLASKDEALIVRRTSLSLASMVRETGKVCTPNCETWAQIAGADPNASRWLAPAIMTGAGTKMVWGMVCVCARATVHVCACNGV